MNTVALEAGCFHRKPFVYLDQVFDSAAVAPTKSSFLTIILTGTLASQILKS